MGRYARLALVAAALSVLAAACGTRQHAGTGTAPAAAGSPAPSGTAGGPAASAPAAQSPGRSSGPGCGAPAEGQPGDSDELTGVQFVSASTGWVAGLDRILGTGDGGLHWVTEYRAPTGAALSSVDFVTASRGWVVGGSTILTTADGGRSWQPLPEPCPLVRTVHFISPAVGFAVAGGSRPLAGLLPAPAGAIPPAGGVLLTTDDGGLRWHRLAAPAGAQTVCFTDRERGWLGAGGRIYSTLNGGRSWTLAVRGPYRAARFPGLAEVECAGPGAAWAELTGPGSYMSQQPHIGYHAAGRTWTPIFAEQYFPHPGVPVSADSPGSFAGPFSAISPAAAVFIDSCVACGEGSAPADLAEDGGAVLLPRGNVGGMTAASAAAFVTLDDGWVVGTLTTYHPASSAASVVNRIVHTADGGRSWQVQYTLAP